MPVLRPCCAAEALDIFLSIIGAEAANMALRGLTTGGVYIAGGIFPKVGSGRGGLGACVSAAGS